MTEIVYTPLRLDAALYRIEASMHISDEDAPIVAHAYRILQTRIEALESIAAGYRDHIDDDCDRSGCLCDLREHRCSGWIDAALAKEEKRP